MAKKTYNRKVGFYVSEELYQRLNHLIEWGERTRVLTKLVEWLCDKIEKHGTSAYVVLLKEDEVDQLLETKKSKEQKDGDY